MSSREFLSGGLPVSPAVKVSPYENLTQADRDYMRRNERANEMAKSELLTPMPDQYSYQPPITHEGPPKIRLSEPEGSNMTNITPLSDYVLIEARELPEETESGLHRPESMRTDWRCRVRAVGPAVESPMIRPGQIVLVSEYPGARADVDGEEYRFVREQDIIAVIE